MRSNRPTTSSSTSWHRPGTYLNRGIQKTRSTAAAISKIAVTTKPEMSPGFTAFQPSKLIRFSLWSTASRMVC